MKEYLKKILKNSKFGIYLLQVYRIFKYYNNGKNSKLDKLKFLTLLLFKVKVYKSYNKGMEIKELLSKVKIDVSFDSKNRFMYNLDIYKSTCDINQKISNLSIDNEKVLNNSTCDFRLKCTKMKDGDFKNSILSLIDGIDIYIDRSVDYISKSEFQNKENVVKYLNNIKTGHASSFEEAMQRILFFNQILWQTNHRLNGLGRLDYILIDLYNKDIKEGKITKQLAKDMIKDFCLRLHENYWFKSNDLIGDTGQIIILGGKDNFGNEVCNELTYLFIEVIKEIKLPDPKILLRVGSNYEKEVLQLAIECIKTGIGSPIFANDDVIQERLKEFGYLDEEVYNYVTAACWEPEIIGKSFAQNNITYLNFLKPLEEMSKKQEFVQISNFDELIEMYKSSLRDYISSEIYSNLNAIVWDKDPLLSIFIDECIQKELDISGGGAKYNNYGVTGVALSNTINSLLILKKYVFEDKTRTLAQMNVSKNNNFIESEKFSIDNEYGCDNDDVINLTNTIINYTKDITLEYKNKFGGKLKFGLSAPSYIIASRDFNASFDGRRYGEPFGVHISSKKNVAYTELVSFASRLDYSKNAINGNVIDFITSNEFLDNNKEKFLQFIILSIKSGFFEMQINVVSSDTLIKAKENPEQFPNLIVRVWGFSAYFNDLPEEYQDYIIRRTLISEGKSI